MDLKTLEVKMLLHKYDAYQIELDIKNQKLNAINDIFMKEIVKDVSISDVVDIAANESDDSKESPINENAENVQENVENAENENITDEDIDNEIDRTPKIELPSDIKNIFRKIVLLTHPDKLKSDDPDRLNKIKMYLDVQKSAQENKISNILLIAYKLGIEIEVDGDYINSLTKEIGMLEIQLKTLEYTTSWVWYYTPNIQLKKIMIERVRDAYRKQKMVSRNNI